MVQGWKCRAWLDIFFYTQIKQYTWNGDWKISEIIHPIFSLYAAIKNFMQENPKEFNASICYNLRNSFWAYFAPKYKCKIFSKKILQKNSMNWLFKKIKKIPCINFWWNLTSLTLNQCQANFGQKRKNKIFTKNLKPFSQFYVFLPKETLCNKSEIYEHQFFIKLAKPHCGPIWAPFCPKTSKQYFSQRKHLNQIIKLSCNKKNPQKYSWCSFFRKLKKNHFGPILSSFYQKTQHNIFFKKKSSSFTLENFYKQCQRKIPDKPTNGFRSIFIM